MLKMIKIPIDTLLEKMTLKERMELFFKLVKMMEKDVNLNEDSDESDTEDTSIDIPRGLDCPLGIVSDCHDVKEDENEDEIRKCAGCGSISTNDLCNFCEPFRETIKKELDTELDLYHMTRDNGACIKDSVDHDWNKRPDLDQLKQWQDVKIKECKK